MIFGISLLDAIQQGCSHAARETELLQQVDSLTHRGNPDDLMSNLPSQLHYAKKEYPTTGESWRDCCSLVNNGPKRVNLQHSCQKINGTRPEITFAAQYVKKSTAGSFHDQ